MKPLAGFRDFYPADCAKRNYILSQWKTVAHRYGFVEYDGPTVEPLALYEKKSGGELTGQLFAVTALAQAEGTSHEAKGVLRPEMTPTLARMVAAHHRDYPKPLKWFCAPQFFRHERNQRGRLREFFQLNCDILGESSPAADAELIATAIDMLRIFGFTESEIVVRLSSRAAWQQFFTTHATLPEGTSAETAEYEFFQIIDKAERSAPEQMESALAKFSLTAEPVLAFMRSKEPVADLIPICADLQARGLAPFVEIDYAIVRGLAYYTGTVFEVFDKGKKERAVAGGGRYDRLLHLMSDGKADIPALGFGIGDVVLGNLIDDTPAAKALMDTWIRAHQTADAYVIVAKEERRPESLGLVQKLREAGCRTLYPFTETKVGKQFQLAEQSGAICAIVVGEEWPQVKLKTLATRDETLVGYEKVAEAVTAILKG